MSDPRTCEACGDEYLLRDGDEPTPICDHCAHAEVARLRETLREWVDAYDAERYAAAAFVGVIAVSSLPSEERARFTVLIKEVEARYTAALGRLTGAIARARFLLRDPEPANVGGKDT